MLLASGTPSKPCSVISNSPSSLVVPKRCFTARTMRNECRRSPSNEMTVSTTCSSNRGPAMLPSLVTWPTKIIATLRALASCTSRNAHSRTWVTEPGADSTVSSAIVCTLSITTRVGFTLSMAATMSPSDMADTSIVLEPLTPIRSARRRTCWALSSALTYNATPDHAPTICSNNVDLPMPGSPLTKVTEPGTRPPSSTRSNSLMPVGVAAAEV